jgi:hypothetical protein
VSLWISVDGKSNCPQTRAGARVPADFPNAHAQLQ